MKEIYELLSKIKASIETDCHIICDGITARIDLDLYGGLIFEIWGHNKDGKSFNYGCAFSEEKISDCPHRIIMLEMVRMIAVMHEAKFPSPKELF